MHFGVYDKKSRICRRVEYLNNKEKILFITQTFVCMFFWLNTHKGRTELIGHLNFRAYKINAKKI